jgi:hypothetical protein
MRAYLLYTTDESFMGIVCSTESVSGRAVDTSVAAPEAADNDSYFGGYVTALSLLLYACTGSVSWMTDK